MGKKSRTKAAIRIQDRLIDELIGICRGVIADGKVAEEEAIFLGQWIENHREIADKWPVNILYARLQEMLCDGNLDFNEQRELLDTLRDLTGETSLYQDTGKSTSLPLCKPAPDVSFENKVFCLTGRFAFGSNVECEETVSELGGYVAEDVDGETDYLVIGELCSPEWEHTTFGRKIEQAVELREKGADISIISEEHWVNSLSNA